MDKVLEELGKGCITLGNIVASLVFLKAYLESADLLLLANGIVFLCVFYFLGARLIYVSTRLKP